MIRLSLILRGRILEISCLFGIDLLMLIELGLHCMHSLYCIKNIYLSLHASVSHVSSYYNAESMHTRLCNTPTELTML